jgi:hypothetical protein
MHPIVRLDCTGLANVRALECELAGFLADDGYDRAGGVLVEFGSGGALLAPAEALGIADAFAARRTHFQGRIALHAAGDGGYVAARFIAIVGRHEGLRMEAFREVGRAVEWLRDGDGRAGAGSGFLTRRPRLSLDDAERPEPGYLAR